MDADTDRNELIAALVATFYERARCDPMLGPVFDTAIHDWEEHLSRIRDFWAHHLLGSGHYSGPVFMPHAVLPLEPAHFDRWLELFGETATEILPDDLCQRAMARATHMSASIKAGMFTVPGHRFGRPPG
ncbi:group III truncated hemoglobin [Azospirillum sp. TSO22-1]|uniref:group III truncated hemoglobin n=1 Tax=Azospirillum sp. TSO22-1 TaxID=716789 RepID=UPI000D6203AF|nr:group III truncated hemoglobin [Azospirillum sp. TSO22-1]PWC32017.1 hypothetical protein TSO221_31810 [Azospirillum sp. TSO22-1]